MTSPIVGPPAASPGAAPVRFCPICKQADDHPRHDIFLTDPNVSPHLDCCAAAGCPDGSCDVKTADQGEKRGDKFREALVKDAEKIQKALDKRADAVKHFTLGDLDPAKHGAIIQAPIVLTEVNQ